MNIPDPPAPPSPRKVNNSWGLEWIYITGVLSGIALSSFVLLLFK